MRTRPIQVGLVLSLVELAVFVSPALPDLVQHHRFGLFDFDRARDFLKLLVPTWVGVAAWLQIPGSKDEEPASTVGAISDGAASPLADERELKAYAEIGPVLTELERRLGEWRQWSKRRPDATQRGLLKTSQDYTTIAYQNYATVTSERAAVMPSEVSERLDAVLEKVRGEIQERTDPTAADDPVHALEMHKAMLAAIGAIDGARKTMQSRQTMLRERTR